MKTYNKFSLRTKIIGMVMMVIIMLVSASYYSIAKIEDYLKAGVLNSYAENAESLSDSLVAQFYERYGDVQAFSQLVGVVSRDQIQPNLDNYVTLYGLYDLILVVDSEGRYVSSNSKDSAGKELDLKKLSNMNFSSLPWFKAAMNGQFTEDKENGFAGTFFEESHVDPIMTIASGHERIMTGFTAQVKAKDGKILGVITNRASTKWIDLELQNMFANLATAGFKKSQLTLINKDGLILAEMNPGENNGSTDVVYDTKRVFHANMKDEHVPAGPTVIEGKSGAMVSQDMIDHAYDVVGYHHIESKKWVSKIGWSVMIHDDIEEVFDATNTIMRNFYIFVGIGTLAAMLLAIFFGISISKIMNGFSITLEKNSGELSDAASKIASSSTELSEASTKQAAALQQTVAAVDQISAMVEKNAEAANRSKDASGHSRDAAVKGRQIVDNMLQAISEISNSNEEVSTQMETSNNQLTEITKLINDIGSKTKVINEIVFQTKLLSFNASVEAARAGEYGKGFAVVAEEVGNLAQMSGNAAKEITTLLEESVRKVESIVSDSKVKVEKLVNDSRDKVRVGGDTARTCNEALEEILTNVSSVDTLISEIAVASQEQATGIREISKAVGEMEQVTKQNSSVAEMSSVAAEQLSKQSTDLRVVISYLTELVQGVGAKLGLPTFAPAKKKEAQVLKFEKKKTAQVNSPSESIRKTANSDSVPSADDPGFGE